MGFEIDAWARALSDGGISVEQGREIVNAVWDRVYELHKQVERLEAVERYKAEEKQKKGGRK